MHTRSLCPWRSFLEKKNRSKPGPMEPWWCSRGVTSWSRLETNLVVLGLVPVHVREVHSASLFHSTQVFLGGSTHWYPVQGPAVCAPALWRLVGSITEHPQRLQDPLSCPDVKMFCPETLTLPSLIGTLVCSKYIKKYRGIFSCCWY